MKEAFLQYLWQYQKFDTQNLVTTDNKSIRLIHIGNLNHLSGPDFKNAKLYIDNKLYSGSIELHLKSSDWFSHNHENDSQYNGVILHIVWEHNVEVFGINKKPIPTVELKQFTPLDLISKYKNLIGVPKKFINCETQLISISSNELDLWFINLFEKRLRDKSKFIDFLFEISKRNWEAVLFKMLARNFGLNINGNSFFSIASSFSFSVVQKCQNQTQLEALFLGQANLINYTITDEYYSELQREYRFLKTKFKLQTKHIIPVEFFKLRPPNFPTIRLSQLADLYSREKSLFSKLVDCTEISKMRKILKSSTSTYWETHFTFQKESSSRKKILTNSFIDLLIINTIIPIKYAYSKNSKKSTLDDLAMLMRDISSEKNQIITHFSKLKIKSKSALESQALIELYKNFCKENRCISCNIGKKLLER